MNNNNNNSSSNNMDCTNHALFSTSRPICLWNAANVLEECQRLDEWGRSVEFTRISYETEYRASKERYFGHPTSTANAISAGRGGMEPEPVKLWNEFCKVHWRSKRQQLQQHQHQDSQDESMAAAAGLTRNATTSTVKAKHLFVDRQLRMAVAA
jgi:hypothetical protein